MGRPILAHADRTNNGARHESRYPSTVIFSNEVNRSYFSQKIINLMNFGLVAYYLSANEFMRNRDRCDMEVGCRR